MRVSWPNALLGCPDVGFAQLNLLEPVDFGVQVEIHVTAVGDEDAVVPVDAVFLEILDLSEETGDVDDAAGADEVHAACG